MYRKSIQIIKIFIIMVIAISNINAQHNNSSLRDDVCYKHESLDIGYYIKLNGKLYYNWETAYICESDLVANIEILYNEINSSPVEASAWDWSECGCTGQNYSNATISIGKFNNIDKKSTIKVQFIEEKIGHPNKGNMVTLILSVYLITNVTINDKATHAIAQYAYDENDIPEYPIFVNGTPTYGTTTPWKFLPNATTDKIVITGHKNLLKGASITTKDINNMPSSSLSYNPTGQELDIHHIGPPGAELNLKTELCSSNLLLNTDTYPMTTITLDVYSLAESDDDGYNYCEDWDKDGKPHEFGGFLKSNDDVPGKGYEKDCMTKIVSKDFSCIDPGIDGSLDLYMHPTWVEEEIFPEDLNKDITFMKYTPMMEVRAGTNLICDTEPRKNNINQFETNIDITKLQTSLNILYNKIGIQINVIYNGVKKLNYDSYKDDNFIDAYNMENSELHDALFPDDGSPENPIAWIVPWIISSDNNSILSGVASKAGGKTLFLSENSFHYSTCSHELGHAYFNLGHPDNNHTQDILSGSVSNDRYNFMNSGNLYNNVTAPLISDLRIRRYQWWKKYDNL